MAIDATGKPMMSTTGPVNTGPKIPKAPKIGNIKMPPKVAQPK